MVSVEQSIEYLIWYSINSKMFKQSNDDCLHIMQWIHKHILLYFDTKQITVTYIATHRTGVSVCMYVRTQHRVPVQYNGARIERCDGSREWNKSIMEWPTEGGGCLL